MKVDMQSTDYYKSGEHKKNVLAARKKASVVQKNNKQKRINDYNLNPKMCKQCNSALSYPNRKNKFCNSSCSAIFNNLNRSPRTNASKLRTSKSLKGRKKTTIVVKRVCNVQFPNCKICNAYFLVKSHTKNHRKTCSRKCSTIASTSIRSYQNGSRKPVWYYNIYEEKDVLLESSWEVDVANKLVERNIKWIRPLPMDWQDSNGKQRLYYPDFYLPEYEIYLDPKNPYCMVKDKEKMHCISSKVNIIYGDINIILLFIESI